MKRLEVSGAVRLIYRSLGVKRLSNNVQSNTTFIYKFYMFRFTMNHHQALSKNTQIQYIKLLKRVLGSQTFIMNFWLWYICFCYSYSIWIFVFILF